MKRKPTAPEATLTRRLVTLNLDSAVAFVLGGSFFAVGAGVAQLASGGRLTSNITYLIGGCFFSLGGYALVLLVVNSTGDGRRRSSDESMRWWTYQPRRRDWLSAVLLLVGTLLFAVSLVAAFAKGLTPRQSDGWIWLPDMIGCVCFLVSGHLALLEVGAGHVQVRLHQLAWWVVVINQIGSILFFLAGCAAFTRPATASALDAGLVNWGTFAGAACFAVGGVLQALDRPTTTAVQRTP